MVLPERGNSESRPRRLSELRYYCRQCKRQVTIPFKPTQIRRGLAAVGSAFLVCAVGAILFNEMRHRYDVSMVGVTAVVLGLCALCCHLTLRSLLRGFRNRRRYPIVADQP